MKLVLIRHAQSLRNLKHGGKTFYEVGEEKIGLPNYLIPITEKGIEQAGNAAITLYEKWETGEHKPPVIIFHSGFVRTRDTASNIYTKLCKLAKESGVELSILLEQNHLLRERDAGHAFEMDKDEAKTHFPHLEDHWKLDGKWFATPPSGESIIQVMDRASLFLSQIVQDRRAEGSTVYAVTHGGTMTAFETVIKKVPFDKVIELVKVPRNCEIVEYEYKNGQWVAVS